MAAGLIASGVIMLLFVSAFFVYFAAETETEFTDSGLVGGLTTIHTSLNLIDNCDDILNSSSLIIKEGEWVCSENGLTSNDTNNNRIFLHKFDILAQREENVTYAEKINIYNPDSKDFILYIAYEYIVIPPYSDDSIAIIIDEYSMDLMRHAYLLGIPDFTIYDTCETGNSSIENYSFALQWDINTGILSVYEDTSKCYMEVILTGQMFNSGGDKYLGGIDVTGSNLTISWIGESIYREIYSSLQKGDWAGFFMDMLAVMGWQTSPDILPYAIQGIVIGIPESCIMIGIAALLYPWGD